MEYLIGVILSAVIVAFAMFTGFDRDRAFYPTVVIVTASYYILFAVMGGSARALLFESLVACAFLTSAVVGFKTNLWWAAAALAGHGVFDFFHGHILDNPGVPPWWPGFCLSFDVGASGLLAAILIRRARAAPSPVNPRA